jgi:hypothetical protein
MAAAFGREHIVEALKRGRSAPRIRADLCTSKAGAERARQEMAEAPGGLENGRPSALILVN